MFPQFDPSKMDPKVLMELSRLIQQLPPEKLNQMQSLMHNMMAGHDVRYQMEEFERSLPPGFREKMMSLMGSQTGTDPFTAAPLSNQASDTPHLASHSTPVDSENETPTGMDEQRARLTILRAVAAGQMSPEEAEKLL
jgi:hypothetical protein